MKIPNAKFLSYNPIYQTLPSDTPLHPVTTKAHKCETTFILGAAGRKVLPKCSPMSRNSALIVLSSAGVKGYFRRQEVSSKTPHHHHNHHHPLCHRARHGAPMNLACHAYESGMELGWFRGREGGTEAGSGRKPNLTLSIMCIIGTVCLSLALSFYLFH